MNHHHTYDAPSHAPRILIVEDNDELRGIYTDYLRERGFRVKQTGTASEAIELAPVSDVVLLDVSLPDQDGWTVAEKLLNDVPEVSIVFVTAMGERQQLLHGFEIGAADYLVKPIDLEELRVRIRAITRKNTGPRPLRFGTLTIDLVQHVVRRDGNPIHITQLQYDLLALLCQHPHRVWTREELLNRVWGADRFVTHRAVDVRLRHLREAIGDDANHPTFIDTIRGQGYKWMLEPEQDEAPSPDAMNP